MVKVGIIGATGYAGNELVRLLMGHKDVQTTYNIYIHILKEQKVDAVSIFNR